MVSTTSDDGEMVKRENGVVERVRKWKGEDAVGADGPWTGG